VRCPDRELLAGDVEKEVCRPAYEKHADDVEEIVEGSCGNGGFVVVRLGRGRDFLRNREFGSEVREEHLILAHVSVCFVVFRVGELPGVEGDEKETVENVSNRVVYPNLLRKTLVSTFMSNNPDPCANDTLTPPVSRPRDNLCPPRQLSNLCRRKQQSQHHRDIHDDIRHGLHGVSLETVSGDGVAHILKGEGWFLPFCGVFGGSNDVFGGRGFGGEGFERRDGRFG